jgi:hypothetical protein
MRTSIVKRSALLSVAVAQDLLLTVGVTTFGISGISLDSLRAHPALFGLLVIGPFLVGCLTLILAAMPRLIQLNLVVFVSLWLLLELIFGIVNLIGPNLDDSYQAISKEDLYASDPEIGFKPSPNSIERHTETYDKQQIFSVIYRTDAMGRRITPVEPGGRRSKVALFFGCSMMFGWGLGDRQTLPYYVGKLAGDYQPYNYSLIGWGPAQMLDLVRTRDLTREIPQKEGIAVFLFIDDHIARVIGASHVAGRWESDLSRYVSGRNGNLVREGSFATGAPLKTLFYWLFDQSNVAHYFEITLPRHYSDKDYRLVAEIFARSGKILEEEFKLQGFYVILSVYSKESREKLIAELQRLGVKYLDFSTLYDEEDIRYRVWRSDWHTSARANRVMAAELVKELGIGATVRRMPSGHLTSGG